MKLRGRFLQEGLKYGVGYGASSVLISHNDLQNEKLGIVICIPQLSLCPAIHNVVPPNQQPLRPPPPNIPPTTCTNTVLALQASL
jgi:hypothetical protein